MAQLFGLIYLSLFIDISTSEAIWESLWKHLITYSIIHKLFSVYFLKLSRIAYMAIV
jgi:hypothetical protein